MSAPASPGGLEQGQREQVGGHRGQRALGVRRLDQRRGVAQHA